MSLEFTKENFQTEVLDYKGTVLVDFWAPWCGPCKMVGPIIEELAKEYEGKVKIGKVDTDKNMSLSINYNIMSIPTMIIFKDGKIVDQFVGAMPKAALKQKLDGLLG